MRQSLVVQKKLTTAVAKQTQIVKMESVKQISLVVMTNAETVMVKKVIADHLVIANKQSNIKGAGSLALFYF